MRDISSANKASHKSNNKRDRLHAWDFHEHTNNEYNKTVSITQLIRAIVMSICGQRKIS